MPTTLSPTPARRRLHAVTPYRPAKPVTTAEVLDAYDRADDTTDWPQLAAMLATHLRHVMNLSTIPAPPAKPVLRPLALLDVAQADKFLLELDDRTRGADLARAMYLLGQAEGHLQNLSEIISTVTELPR